MVGNIIVGYSPDAVAYDTWSNTIYVSNHGSGTITIIFTPGSKQIATYSVSFEENGLPSMILWSVTMNGTTEPSTKSTITFTEANGSYSYSVSSENEGYVPVPSSGVIDVVLIGDLDYGQMS